MPLELVHSSAAPPQPVAKVRGQPLAELPADLYIPPDALEVFLDTFEGPLALLLYLIRKEEVDIYNIPIERITTQYMEYLGLMRMLDLNIAGEFIVMAATLMMIKSRMLLPVEDQCGPAYQSTYSTGAKAGETMQCEHCRVPWISTWTACSQNCRNKRYPMKSSKPDRIHMTPDDTARLAFYAENFEEPVCTTAKRVATKYEIDETHPIVDDIQRVIENAYELGKKYGARFGSN